MVDRDALENARQYLRNLETHGMRVSFGVLFGSHARGDFDQWSDIDLMVVSPQFDGPVHMEDLNLLWRVAARTDSRIEPVPCGERQWADDTASPIVEIARTEGECVYAAPADVPLA